MLPSSGRKSGSGGCKGVPPQHQCDILPKFHHLKNYCHDNKRWFKYDRDYLCINKPQSVPVIFEPPCTNISAIDADSVWVSGAGW